MHISAENKPQLRAWLVRTLEPICDADPGALADYVAALLERDVPEQELRKELASQLDEFLEKDGPIFIDTLFTVLRTKSYIPYAAAEPGASADPAGTSADEGIPIPLDAVLAPASPGAAGRKRGLADDGDAAYPPAKGPRLGGFANGRHDRRDYGPGANGGGMDMGHTNPNRSGRQRVYIPPEQMHGICRDYHVKGYCARGAFCKYSHSDDAVVPGQMMMGGPPPGGMPFMPMYGGSGGLGGAYDPHEARMDMRGGGGGGGMGKFHFTQRPAIMARGDEAAAMSGELPVIQDLTPQDAADGEGAPGEGDDGRPRRIPEYVPPRGDVPRRGPPMGPMGGMPMGMPGMGMGMGMPMDVDGRAGGGPMQHGMMGMQPGGMMGAPGRGGFHGVPTGPRNGMRGTFNGALAASFDGDVAMGGAPGAGNGGPARPERRQDKTLVVEKIPPERLSIEAVTAWFGRFGTVTNVAVDHAGGKALVSFEDHAAAREAWRSEDAVFGNRFVKVFWHRPMTGHGAKGTALLAASAPLVTKLSTDGTGTSTSTGGAPTGHSWPGQSVLAQKQQLLEQHISEQKALMARLASAAPEEKKELFAQLRRLGEEIKRATAGAPVPTVSVRAAPARDAPPHLPPAGDDDARKREQLDRELDMHAAAPAEAGAGAGGEGTEALRAQLAKLKAEAASLGIPEGSGAPQPQPPAYAPGGFRGGYRGRGRARGFFRGAPAARGGRNMSLRLDNRPKKLVVKGVPAENVQAVRDWYETTGGVASVDSVDGGDLVVSFHTRGAAEQGLAKGANIPAVGQVQVSWHAAPAPAGKTNGAAAPAPTNGAAAPAPTNGAAGDTTMYAPGQDDLDGGDDLLPTTGWGADDEDGMGLM